MRVGFLSAFLLVVSVVAEPQGENTHNGLTLQDFALLSTVAKSNPGLKYAAVLKRSQITEKLDLVVMLASPTTYASTRSP